MYPRVSARLEIRRGRASCVSVRPEPDRTADDTQQQLRTGYYEFSQTMLDQLALKRLGTPSIAKHTGGPGGNQGRGSEDTAAFGRSRRGACRAHSQWRYYSSKVSTRIRLPKKQVIELWDSIARNYPIGSLLLWRSRDTLKAERTIADLAIGATQYDYSVNYLLEGRQRLSSVAEPSIGKRTTRQPVEYRVSVSFVSEIKCVTYFRVSF